MDKTKENNGKHPKRDDFGMVGNFGRELPILFPRVSHKSTYPKRIELNNPVPVWYVQMNANPP